jgi:opine dehydrogenase
MKVAILGAGAMGLASATYLASRGHRAVIWSPSGRSTEGLAPRVLVTASGALSGTWDVDIAHDLAAALDRADAVLLAVDAGGHAPVMQAAAPHLKPDIPFIIGAAHSMSALYLSGLLAERGIRLPIVSWNTTIGTAHKTSATTVDIRTLRPKIDAAVLPSQQAEAALAVCLALFGDRFERRSDALAIALLSNSNPVFHVPVCLLNVSRIERGEDWAPYQQTSASIGRLMEALDRERIAIGAAFGHAIHSVNEHFHRSFRIPLDTMAHMNAALHASGRGPHGPNNIEHRYLSQDLTYGLVFAAEIARLAGVNAPVHDATIALASATLGRDYRAENALLPHLKLEGLSRADILGRASEGQFE